MSRFGDWIEVRRLRREYLAAIAKNPQPVVLSPLPDPDTVTITISREDAEHWAQHHPSAIGQYEQRIANSVRATLEAEQ